MRGTVNSRRARSRACPPSRSRSSSSASSRSSAARRAAASPGGTTRPVTPSRLAKRTPVGSAVDTTGVPAACASICTRPNASLRATLGRQSTSAARYHAASSASSCGGKKVARVPAAAAARRSSVLEGAATDEHEVGVEAGHGPHQHVDALVVHQAPDEEHEPAPAAGGAQLRCALAARRAPAAACPRAGRTGPPGTCAARGARNGELRTMSGDDVTMRSTLSRNRSRKGAYTASSRRWRTMSLWYSTTLGSAGAASRNDSSPQGYGAWKLSTSGGVRPAGPPRAAPPAGRERPAPTRPSSRRGRRTTRTPPTSSSTRAGALVADQRAHLGPCIARETLAQPADDGLHPADVGRRVVLVHHGDAGRAGGAPKAGRHQRQRRRPARTATPWLRIVMT